MDVFSDLKLKLKLMTEKSLITIGVKAAQGEGVGWSELPTHAKGDGLGSGSQHSY